MAKKQNMPARTLSRLDERKMVIAGAVVGAVGIGLMGFGAMSMSWGYGMMGSAYAYAVSPYGFALTPFGWLVRLLWGAIIGAVGGYVIAWAYNKA